MRMNYGAVLGACLGLLASVASAAADPVTLKLAMFSADTEMTWVKVIKPWAERINETGKGIVQIDMYPNGALGRALPEQSQMVLNGVADIAFVIPGVTPGRFPDNEVMDLPGLFRTSREATETYTHLIATGQLKSFKPYFVIGAMATPPFEIDSRSQITSLATLKGRKIRVTNPSQSATLQALGAVPLLMPVDQVAEAIGRGTIDGATEFPGPLLDFGIDRVTRYSYFMPVGVSSLTLLMSKAKFDSLPAPAQDILRSSSGEWVARQFVDSYGGYLDTLYEKLYADPNRTITQPTQDELQTARAAFDQVVTQWTGKAEGNGALVQAVRDELARLRSH
jgi:TRAP-type C4-dicarboxylate transport system substrate-binding protein